MAPIESIASISSLQEWLCTFPDALHVLFCFASWDAPSRAGGQMDVVVSALASLHGGACFGKVDADAAGEVLDQFAVESVPTFVFLKVHGARVGAWLDVR